MVDPIFPYAYLAAEKIARIFDGRTVSPVIPKLFTDRETSNIERKLDTLQKIKIQSAEYAYKLILGGEGGVGKTSMVHRFVEDSFQTDYKSTIGTSIMKKECDFQGLESKVRFVIWDLAGQAQFKRVRQTYLANAEAGILVYDVTRKDTIDSIESWFKETKSVSPKISLIMVGNKIDLKDERVISPEQGEKLALKLGLSYIETSAKTGANINDAFNMLALQMIKRFLFTEEV
jgi:small GTP-binding protein